MPIISEWDIRHNQEVFHAGEVISILPAEEEKRLVDEGYAQYVEAAEVNSGGGGSTVKNMSITSLKKHLASVTDLDEVRRLLEEENADDPRKGAVEVLTEKLQQLVVVPSVREMTLDELEEYLADVADPAEVERMLAEEQADEPREDIVSVLTDCLQQLTDSTT